MRQLFLENRNKMNYRFFDLRYLLISHKARVQIIKKSILFQVRQNGLKQKTFYVEPSEK